MIPCKTCTSERRAWIEHLRMEGIPAGVIAKRLLQEYGESITGESLRRHFRQHFDVTEAVAEKYAASEQLRDVAAGRRLSDVQRLDAIIADASARAATTGKSIDLLMAEHKQIPMALVEAHKASMSEARQAIRQKADLLGDQPTDSVDRLLQARWGGGAVASEAMEGEPEVPPVEADGE